MSNTKELTERQVEVVKAISKYVTKNGYPPSVRDISDALGGISTNAVVGHLDKLEEKGCIKRTAGIARSIVIVR